MGPFDVRIAINGTSYSEERQKDDLWRKIYYFVTESRESQRNDLRILSEQIVNIFQYY